MSEQHHSERRLIENEEIMEALNRRVQEQVERIRAEGGDDPDAPVSFFCECSDLTCRERVVITPERYAEIHLDPSRFIVLAGHEIDAIESVVDTWRDYLIVRTNVIG